MSGTAFFVEGECIKIIILTREKFKSSFMKFKIIGFYKIWVFLIFTGLFTTVNAQKVAVVLSGGGARGAAHIGVLKALEENNIPIDYITGTSIGAMIAGLYAAGYSPEEMETFFLSGNFQEMVSGELTTQHSDYYTRDDKDAGWISLDLDFKKKLSKMLPTNIISLVEMDFVFMKLFASASAVAGYNFDSLFIPFRCVAADIDSNKVVVLQKGDLGRSIRASLTFPFYFKPIEIDNKLLFDGGMYNNFPSDVAMENFHPDVIIGSKVSGNYEKPDPDDVVSQIQNMLMSNTNFDIPADKGVLIEPPVEKVDLLDFSKSKEFIEKGYNETIKQLKNIQKLVKSTRDTTLVDERRKAFNATKPPYLIDTVVIEGLKKHEANYVYRTLLCRSNVVSLDEIQHKYYNLATDDKLKIYSSRLVFDTISGKFMLRLGIKPADKFLLKFGGNISTQSASEAFVELQYKYLFSEALKLKTNVYFGRFYSSALLGGRLDFPGKLPFYLGAKVVFNYYDYFKTGFHFIEDITPSFLLQDNNYFRVYGGIPATTNGKLEASVTFAGLEDEYYQTNIFSREDTADMTQFRCIPGMVKWELNTLNRKQFATAGARFMIRAGYLGGNETYISGSLSGKNNDYEQRHNWGWVDVVWDNYFQKLGPVKLGFYGEVYLSDQDFFSNYTSSLLAAPAFAPFPAVKTLFLPYFRSYNYGAVGIKGIVSIFKHFDFRAEGYMYQPYREILKAPDNTAFFGEKFAKRYFMFTGALVFHTFIGPISLTANYFNNPDQDFSVALNIGYVIFNQKALE
jgi:NTE family protein